MKNFLLVIFVGVIVGSLNLKEQGDFSIFRKVKYIEDLFHEELCSLENKSLISEWNMVFDRMKKEAQHRPEFYQKVILGFVNQDNSLTPQTFFIPRKLSEKEVEIIIRYLSVTVNNYILTRCAKKVYVDAPAHIYERLRDYFNQNYRDRIARTPVGEIVSVYNNGEKFEIFRWNKIQIAQLQKERMEKKNQNSSGSILKPLTIVAVNIGKTKIKFGLLEFKRDGTFEIKKVIDKNVWEEGEDKAKFEVLFEKITSGIKEILLGSGFGIEDIDGIGLSGSVIIKDSNPLPLRVGFARFFSERSLQQLSSICEKISREFSGIPVLMGNDGNMEALAVSKTQGLRNALVLKFGTTLASGYVGENVEILKGVNEFNRVVIDMGREAVVHTGMMVGGCAGCYIGWWGIENVAKLLGLYKKYNFEPKDKVPLILKSWLTNGTAEQKEDAEKVFRKVGEYITELALELFRFYRIDNVVISGGLVSGKVGEIILEAARDRCNKLSFEKNVNFLLSSTDLDILRYGALIGAGYLLTDLFSTDMK